jgi:outer membrane protein assembly factor BamB
MRRGYKEMNAASAAVVALVLNGPGVVAAMAADSTQPAPGPTDLVGAWAGTVTHDGATSELDLELEPGTDGKVLIRLSIPATHVERAPVGRAPLVVEGDDVRVGPFAFRYDPKAGTLSGVVPEEFAPVYHLPVALHRVERLDLPAWAEPTAPTAEPVWTFDAGAPLWAGARFADGVVYAGGEDGTLHALDAASGQERWSFRAQGAIRTRPTVLGAHLFFQADDGYLYKVAAATGTEVWRVKVVETPIVRLPFNNPQSRYDRIGSDVTMSGGRLYLGTHDGKVLALDPAQGRRLWQFAAGDSVIAAPAVDSKRVYFGSFDGNVYALDAATGSLSWKHDTRKPVVSTPAVAGDRVLVGSRSYDFLALSAATGEPAWNRYVWFSWVESSATMHGGVAYVGSSDAAAVFAIDAATGRSLWTADVHGWSWGQPAVTEDRVFIGTSSASHYVVAFRGLLAALDRATGAMAWRYELKAPESGTYGSPGSPAVGDGRVFFTTLDGRVLAFKQ